MIFKLQKRGWDTCGNTWNIGEPYYYEEDSIDSLWRRIGSPKICGYYIKDEFVFSIRTPKGMGYGIWESNPHFDWDKNKNVATGFMTPNLYVTKIKVEK